MFTVFTFSIFLTTIALRHYINNLKGLHMKNNDFKQMFSKRLKHFLDLNDMTQAELARRIGVAESTVHSWINTQRIPRMDKIDKLCAVFGINRSDLISDKKSVNNDIYFLDKKTRDIAEAIANNHMLKLLFDVARNIPDEKLQAVYVLLKSIQEK